MASVMSHSGNHRMLPSAPTLLVAIALVLLPFSGPPAHGQSQQDELSEMELIERVAFLQHELESPEVSKRDAAEKELVSHGVNVLDYLEPTTPTTPSDAIERTNRVRKQLETIAVAMVTQASRVTLQGKTTVGKALQQIRDQTQNDVALPEGIPDIFRDKDIELSLDEVTFWEALAEVMDQGELVVDPYAGAAGQLRLSPTQTARIRAANPDMPDIPKQAAKPNIEIPRSVSGIFSISVTEVTASRNLTHPELNFCNVNILVRWEPRVRPISIQLPAKSLRVVDEFDAPVVISNQDAVMSGIVQPEIPELEFSIPIGLVDRQVESIQSLVGEIKAVLPGRVETFRFKNLGKIAAGTKKSKAGATVTFGGIAQNEDLFGITIGLSFDEGHNALESHQSWVYNNPIYLENEAGEKFKALARESVRQSNNEVVIRYYFEQDPNDLTLYYKTPAAIVAIPVKIMLKNIPLP